MSCLTKLEKLLCLKYLGRRLTEKEWGSQTTKLVPSLLQETILLIVGSSTMSYVLVRKGGGPTSWRPSIGCGGGIFGGCDCDGESPPYCEEELDPLYSSLTGYRKFMALIQILERKNFFWVLILFIEFSLLNRKTVQTYQVLKWVFVEYEKRVLKITS